MKRIYILTFVLLVMGFVRGDASVTRAQDPLVVNSKTIVLKLENSRVRVLEATLKPGDQERTHSFHSGERDLPNAPFAERAQQLRTHRVGCHFPKF